MSEERKAKAAARRAAKKEKKITAFEAKPIEAPASDIVTPDITKPQSLEHSEEGRVLDAAVVTAHNGNAPRPIVGNAVKTTPEVLTPEWKANELANVNPITPQQAVKNNPEVSPIQPRVITIADMLEGQRRKITQDKTDAAKMQKYYALSDALKALGQMGGAAIGGAVGGNALDSAPKVAEYKANRGYLDAFEKAKQANDRLRALDEKEFNLNYNKQLRDEDRAYREGIAEAERKFRAEQAELERKWKTASAAERAKIEKEILASKQAHEIEKKKLSLEYAKIMMSGKGGSKDASTRTGSPVIFDDDSVAYIDKEDITALKNRYMNRTIGDVTIDEENFNQFIAQNPQIVKDYLKRIGKDTPFLTSEPEATAPSNKNESVTNETIETVDEKPKKSFWNRVGQSMKNMGESIDTPAAGSIPKRVKREGQYYIDKYDVNGR